MKLRNKKTGEVWGNAVIESYLCAEGYRLIVKVNKDASLGKHYDSLSELNEEWEDCKPTEPLIKDPKIRKAVRAWAEANEIEEVAVLHHSVWEANLTEIAKIDNINLRIVFLGDLGIKRGYAYTSYTITELCGEE